MAYCNGTPSDPDWCKPCLDAIKAQGGVQCSEQHCDSTLIVSYSHAFCNCCYPWAQSCKAGPYPCNPTPPGCCPNNNATPVPVADKNCWCCCGCFANNTPVAFNKDEYKEIQEFQVGDLVYVADDIHLKSWSQRPVLFSSGTGDTGANNPMLRVVFGTPENHDYLLVNRYQLFLVPGAKLKPAAKLLPGKDSLVAADGTPRPVLALEVGNFKKGMHHIATSLGITKSPGGHLIVAKGIVAGDWSLQVSLAAPDALEKLPLVDDFVTLPEFGTRDYVKAYSHLEVSHHRAAIKEFTPAPAALVNEAGKTEIEFEAYDQSKSAYIPEDAFSLLTSDQAFDIASFCPMSPTSSNRGKDIILHLFKFFGAFYPDISFYYDQQNLTPNAYLFQAYGVQHIVVTGALGRCEPLLLEGFAVTLATLVGATLGGPPVYQEGMSCLGAAGYAAITGVLPYVWPGMQSRPIVQQGIPQFQDFLHYIPKKDRGGSDTCMHISTDCLIKSMNAAFQLLPLPHCAGGPPDPALEVNGADGSIGEPHGSVTINFNLAVEPATATEPGNYAIQPTDSGPSAPVFEAVVQSGDPMTVRVTTDLDPKTQYSVTVTGVLSVDQQPLVPGKDQAQFTTK